ncbi:glycosyltransferase [Pasteurella multocida]|nr:glycosyltransferase [Pasteurella multocida]ARA71001.1 glycosyltransferase [Pasteurella multocida subsp. multocida]ARA88471.1 glycosyltransferase [Pasteurella multocida subsp. septica]MCL7760612.1 glycosyltransferase [Pasteurella multocida]MCL7779029.1 glycosyltransferase [Pasteurella multocida]MCL7780887.1 glycosyltransferase [Pasteurella multocida]
MNILFVHKSLVVGGAERILINYLNILSGFNEFKVTLLLLENKGEDNKNINQINKNINIDFILDNSESRKYTEFENKINQRSIFRKIYKYKLSKINKIEENRIKKYIKNKEFDLIVNFNSHLDFFLSNNQINIPIIRWIHGQAHLDDWCNRREWYQNILPKHTYFFAITKEMQKNAQKILLSYGIQEKLYIVGDGECREKLEKQIESLNLQEDCFLLGNKDNPYPLIKNAKLFLHTSLKEGLPTVILESMACGTPVISMDCPTGPKEILRGGEFGGLVNLGDENAFIQKTLSFLQNQDEYNHYCNKLEQAISPFRFEEISTILLSHLQKFNS